MTTFADLPSQETPDGALVRAYLAGDENAFTLLHARYHRYVVGLLGLRVDGGLAEELAQETWFKFVQYAGSYDTARPFRPWIRQVAINVYRAEMSRRGVEVPLDDVDHAEPAAPDLAETVVDLDRVLACLSRMRPRHRVALVMRYVEDRDANAIASLFGLKRNALEQMLRRARKEFRLLYGPREAAFPVLAAAGLRLRRLLDGIAARLQAVSGATFSAGDLAFNAAALTLGSLAFVHGMQAPGRDPSAAALADGRPAAAVGAPLAEVLGDRSDAYLPARGRRTPGAGQAAAHGAAAKRLAGTAPVTGPAAVPVGPAPANPANLAETVDGSDAGGSSPTATASTGVTTVTVTAPDDPTDPGFALPAYDPDKPSNTTVGEDGLNVQTSVNPSAAKDGGTAASAEAEVGDKSMPLAEVTTVEVQSCSWALCSP